LLQLHDNVCIEAARMLETLERRYNWK